MTIKIAQKENKIELSCLENKNLSLSFNSDGSNLNNEKLINFLIKMSAQEDNDFKVEYDKNSQEQIFLANLIQKFSQKLKQGE